MYQAEINWPGVALIFLTNGLPTLGPFLLIISLGVFFLLKKKTLFWKRFIFISSILTCIVVGQIYYTFYVFYPKRVAAVREEEKKEKIKEAVLDLGFLSKSSILKKHDLRITPVELLPSGQVLVILFADSLEKFSLITSEGLVGLKYTNSKAKLPLSVRTCGDPETRFPFDIEGRNNKYSASLAVVGKIGSSLSMKWSPAQNSTDKKMSHKCVSANDSFDQAEYSLKAVAGLKQEIYFSLLKRKKPKDLTLDNEVDLVLQNEIEELGQVEGSKCTVLLKSSVDSAGQGFNRGRLGSLLGMLEIIDGSEKETWLVFSAEGYEGDAILGIPLKENNTDDDMDFFVYSGC